jgi:hypothetical protein
MLLMLATVIAASFPAAIARAVLGHIDPQQLSGVASSDAAKWRCPTKIAVHNSALS